MTTTSSDPRISLSLADLAFPLVDYDLVFHIAARLGFRGVDLCAHPVMAHITAAAIINDPPGVARTVVELYEAHGLLVSDFFPQPDDIRPTPSSGYVSQLAANVPGAAQQRAAREWFHRMLEFAVMVGAPGLTLLPGVRWDEDPASSLARASDELAWRVSEGAAHGIVVSVEPHLNSIIDTPREALELVARTPDLKLTVDYSHFIRAGFADSACEPLLPYARHMHARCATVGALQSSMRDNAIDFRRIVGCLQSLDYHGYVCCENLWFPPLNADKVDNLSETVLLRDLLVASLTTSEARR
jgi:sugar phosphate isomerase/epimerase